MHNQNYSHSYDKSHALIIGINNYLNASPLAFAVNDAKAVSDLLIDEFSFERDNVRLLLDEDASKSNIMQSFLAFAKDGSGCNDRIFIFFAGHGTTESGARGEVGYLVPHDSDPKSLSTLIRWDELTRNADLIPAKHILFIMDACYGGLAINRHLPTGSMRFLKDMLQRPCRQVLTAGKANEVVADSGGPIPEHSVFTGHFIQALQGKAKREQGIITANGVMAYVYDRVSKDQNSNQTPHYGFLDGDGDFIFKLPIEDTSEKNQKIEEDIFVSIPAISPQTNQEDIDSIIDKTKEYLSDNRYKIKLHDLFSQKLRETILQLSDEKFNIQGIAFSEDELLSRLASYEKTCTELQLMASCVAYWGNRDHHNILTKCFTRLCDKNLPENGLSTWKHLQWYPFFILLYSAGISSLAANNYTALASLFSPKVQSSTNSYDSVPITHEIGYAISDLHDEFKKIPQYKKKYVPISEYLFKTLQSKLEDLFLLGRDYEELFDRFEIFLALIFTNEEDSKWAPLGRYCWKYKSKRIKQNTFITIREEANKAKSEWGPLKAGLFEGSSSNFLKAHDNILNIINSLNWH